MRILVLDQTHGGDKIGAIYAARGHDVTLVDIHRTMTPEDYDQAKAWGLKTVTESPAEMFDLVVVPVHCPDHFIGQAKYSRRMGHHQAVGELIRFDYPVIEVTGTSAKTSTCSILAHILSKAGKKVLLHSSRGDFEYSDGIKMLKENTSIAPASLIELSHLKGYDVAVAEVSLGGTGISQVSVITTIGDNYDIAERTRKAFDGKVTMLEYAWDKIVIPENEQSLWEAHIPPTVDRVTFGAGGNIDVSFDLKLQIGVPVTVHVKIGDTVGDVELPGTFLAPAYRTALKAAMAAAYAFGIEAPKIIEALQGFPGTPGRGEIEREGDWYLVRDRNPGVSARSIAWNLDILQNIYGIKDIGLVIDPMNRKVCDRLDMNAILNVAKARPSVKKVYMFDREKGDGAACSDLPHIKNVSEVWAQHKVLLWCTKEGSR
ncbi:MAG: UDP-N-acetylmuramate--L-alanine ligase [Methanomassiliicoccales archaeon PtaU1.Bin124]|nr:MAG: UDP-N-acetylmuramate--L-alanine ligase [Methanomassiliicoccales archaeon PtaU1.Bin124]